MSVRLILGEPHVVAAGPTWEEAGWGAFQFPSLRRIDENTIAARYHIVPDNSESYGLESGWSLSQDNGVTWRKAEEEEIPAVKARFGTRLPSGKTLRSITPRPCPLPDEVRQKLLAISGGRRNGFPVEDMPKGYFETDKWLFAISPAEEAKETEFYSKIDFPGMTLRLTTGAVVRPDAFGPVDVAPDGSIWVSHYENGRNPRNLGFTSYYACYYFKSLDEGQSFQLQSWIQYLPDTNEFPEAFTTEGFCEPCLCFMEDGSMITLMRTGCGTPSYLARSTDGGKSWNKPVKFDTCGVFPQLLRLKCGVTLASYGRPGIYVRASEDPSGQKWDEPVTVMPKYEGAPNSCCYTWLQPLGDNTALLAYSDFGYPDKNGIRRKTILVRTVKALT